MVLEYENNSLAHDSPAEMQPSVRIDKSYGKTSRTITMNSPDSEMSSDVKDSSMMEIFNQEAFNRDIDEFRPNSTLDNHHTVNSHPSSMIETAKFRTFNDVSIHTRTIIEPTKKNKVLNTRNKSKNFLNEKFNSHTIQCDPANKRKVNINSRKRSVSRKEASIGEAKKKSSVYQYMKKSLEDVDFNTTEHESSTHDKRTNLEYQSFAKETLSSKNKKQISRKPKVSKPTKTITMTICEDGYGKICTNDNSLRNSREGLSNRASIISKKTPQNTNDSIKFGGLSTTKPTTHNYSEKTRAFGSSTTEETKSGKIKNKKNALKNCKSQTCFQKNPIHSHTRFNRLKKIKKNLDKQQTLINEIYNIKESLERKAAKLKRSTSRTNRRNTLLHETGSLSNNTKVIRSRSKTDFNPQKHKDSVPKPVSKKTNIYTLDSRDVSNNYEHQKLSRNPSQEPKELKSKSFVKTSPKAGVKRKESY